MSRAVQLQRTKEFIIKYVKQGHRHKWVRDVNRPGQSNVLRSKVSETCPLKGVQALLIAQLGPFVLCYKTVRQKSTPWKRVPDLSYSHILVQILKKMFSIISSQTSDRPLINVDRISSFCKQWRNLTPFLLNCYSSIRIIT